MAVGWASGDRAADGDFAGRLEPNDNAREEIGFSIVHGTHGGRPVESM